jgi:phage-related baseplate assembly protein
MSGLVLAEKDPAVVLAEALAKFKEEYEAATGKNGTLQPADPRRIFLQTDVLLHSQQRSLIDYAGKQSLLRFVSNDWIDDLAALWGEERIAASPSTTLERFSFATSSARTVPGGVRVSDGTNTWRVIADTSNTGTFVDAFVECIDNGRATNEIAEGQITTLVDPDLVPGCTGVTNIRTTSGGRDLETADEFRVRLRDAPENRSTCGPRGAYEAFALEASGSVADVVALGPNDEAEMAGGPPDPGEVWVLLLEGERDDAGVLTSVIPEPSDGLLATVIPALSEDDVRPLTDSVIVRAPSFHDFDCIATYYIGESREDAASAIQDAVEEAFDAYLLWQQSKIGRDVNPSMLTVFLMAAGAKRVAITQPTFTQLMRDQSARLSYQFLGYGGIEDD